MINTIAAIVALSIIIVITWALDFSGRPDITPDGEQPKTEPESYGKE